MAAKNKQLPPPCTCYYVGEPVIVIPLANYECLASYLMDIAMIDRKDHNRRSATQVKYSSLLAEVQGNIKTAKAYFHIISSENDSL